MGKVLFIPVSILGGLLAGLIGKKLFEWLWGLVDDQEPPDAQHQDVSWAKLVPALAVQGAVFGVTRGLTDHASRQAFYRATGAWPGEPEPESKPDSE